MTKTERDLTDGRRHHDAGEFVKAEAIYNRILKREPENLHAKFFLGALKTQTGRHDEAVKLLEQVIEVRPTWEEAHNNLAVALQNLGRISEALAHYEEASELNPNFAEAHSNATYCLQLLKRNGAALKSAERALELQADNYDALINRANLLNALGRKEEARDAMVKASQHVRADRETRMSLGVSLILVDEHEKAIEIFEAIVKEFPDHAPGYNYLAASLERTVTPFTRRDVHQRMIDLLDKCIELDPEYLDGIINRATVLQKLRRTAEAREIFENVVDKVQERYDVLNNYAAILQESGRYDEAIDHCRRALAITDQYGEPLYNWGACLHLKGDLEGARLKYEEALKKNPLHVDSHSALALLYLTLGNFERGWEEYEWRKQTDQFSGRLFDDYVLDPKKIAGRKIMLHAEQGQGDTFQFIRYAHVIKECGGFAFVECHDGLRDLVKTCPWVDSVRERADSDNLIFDAQANMLSLPFLFKTNLESVPSQVPYLFAPESHKPKWDARVAELTPPGTRLKVGIAWAGNPDHYNDKQRSTTLDKFGALAGVEGVTFFSLQKGQKPEEQLKNPPAGLRIVALGQEIESFSDTAAILENLDMVIAVDTSVAHLAGAMGIPVWTLLPLSNDFRWLTERDDTPWYPTMRLFRQRELWGYDFVFEQVAKELEKYAADPVLWNIDDATRKFDNGGRSLAKVQLLALTSKFANDTRLINTIGELLWSDGDTQEALQMFTAALQLNPNDRRSIANCAQVLAAYGQRADAQILYHNYMTAHPDDEDFADALADLIDEPQLVAA